MASGPCVRRVELAARELVVTRVLHVAESMGSGVETAIATWIDSSPELEHSTFSMSVHEHSSGVLISATERSARSGRIGRTAFLARRLHGEVRDRRPDVVHLHSSVAGALGRLMPRLAPRVVYSPHCFAFERNDLRREVRRSLMLAERLLSTRCDAVVAVSEHERELADSLRSRTPVYLVPNFFWNQLATYKRPCADSVHVVGLGRVGPQKGVLTFASVSSQFRGDQSVRFTWIGSGDPTSEAHLRRAGCTVTGWLRRDEALRVLMTGDVYLHTASWEGFPLAIPEAAGLGLPVLAFRIPALEFLPESVLVSSIEDAVDRIRLVEQTDQHMADSWLELRDVLSGVSGEQQRQNLLRSYGLKP